MRWSSGASANESLDEAVKRVGRELDPFILLLRVLVADKSDKKCAEYLGALVIRVTVLMMELSPNRKFAPILRSMADWIDRTIKEES